MTVDLTSVNSDRSKKKIKEIERCKYTMLYNIQCKYTVLNNLLINRSMHPSGANWCH